MKFWANSTGKYFMGEVIQKFQDLDCVFYRVEKLTFEELQDSEFVRFNIYVIPKTHIKRNDKKGVM